MKRYYNFSNDDKKKELLKNIGTATLAGGAAGGLVTLGANPDTHKFIKTLKDEMQEKAGNVIDSTANVIKARGEDIGEAFEGAKKGLDYAGQSIKSAAGNTGKFISDRAEDVGEFVGKGVDKAKDMLNVGEENSSEYFSRAYGRISSNFSMYPWASALVEKFKNKRIQSFSEKDILEKFNGKESKKDLLKKIGAATLAGGAIGGGIAGGKYIKNLKDELVDTKGKLADTESELVDTKENLEKAKDIAQDSIDIYKNSLSGKTNQFLTDTRNAGADALKGVVDTSKEVGGAVKQWGTDVANDFKKWGSERVDDVKEGLDVVKRFGQDRVDDAKHVLEHGGDANSTVEDLQDQLDAINFSPDKVREYSYLPTIEYFNQVSRYRY